jgi:hypothetical protein
MLIALFVAAVLAQPAPCQSTHGAADVEWFARELAASLVTYDRAAFDALLVDECAFQVAQFNFGPAVTDDLARVARSEHIEKGFREGADGTSKRIPPVGELVFLDRDPATVREGEARSFRAYFRAGTTWTKLAFDAVRIDARWYLAGDRIKLRDATEQAQREYWEVILERLITALDNTRDPGATIDSWWSKYRATLEGLAPFVRSLSMGPRHSAREPYLWLLFVLRAKAPALDTRLAAIGALYGEPVTLARAFGDSCDPFYAYIIECMRRGEIDANRGHHRMLTMISDCSDMALPTDGKCPDLDPPGP